MKLRTIYLRDLDLYPLIKGESGETTNPQEGKCNNFNYRNTHHSPTPIYIMQHYTVSDCDNTIKLFTTNPTSAPVSAHFVIDRDGVIQVLIDPAYRAYHAGSGNLCMNSKLNPYIPEAEIKNDMNSWSIGIENVNNGNEEFSLPQIQANIVLCQKLYQDYPVNPVLMIAHSDWAIGRKKDTGIFFPWEYFANATEDLWCYDAGITTSFGIFPRKSDLDLRYDPNIVVSYDGRGVAMEDLEYIQNNLRELGYDIPESEIGTMGRVKAAIGDKTQASILAFRTHFSGDEIREDPVQRQAWSDLCANPENSVAKAILSQFNANDLACLGDMLDHL